MKSLCFLSLLLFSTPVFANQTVTCFSEGASGRVTAELDQPGVSEVDWTVNTAKVKGYFQVLVGQVVVLVPFEVDLRIEARVGPDLIDGTFRILNPYLNGEMILFQRAATYNEVHIMRNRLFSERDVDYTTQPGDVWGFNIICMIE